MKCDIDLWGGDIGFVGKFDGFYEVGDEGLYVVVDFFDWCVYCL